MNDFIDQSLDQNLRRLTPEQIMQTVETVLRDDSHGRLKTYVNTCDHCGLCSEACQYLLSNGYDPLYTPASRIKNRLGELIRRGGRVSPQAIRGIAEIVYAENSPYTVRCPFGIDIAFLMNIGRHICQKLGVPRHQSATKHPQKTPISKAASG